MYMYIVTQKESPIVGRSTGWPKSSCFRTSPSRDNHAPQPTTTCMARRLAASSGKKPQGRPFPLTSCDL